MRRTLDIVAPMVGFCKKYSPDVVLKAIETVECIKENPVSPRDVEKGEELFQVAK